nr:hypothetical protein GCM10020093_025890 [Planobispora longispora]
MTKESSDLYPVARLAAAQEATAAAGLDALLLTPSPDLRYITGYEALPLERLTCLVLPARGDAFMMVPRLELPAAEHSPASRLGVEFVAWDETDDPYAVVAARLGKVGKVGLADLMWAMQSLRFRDALPGAEQVLAARSCASCACARVPPRSPPCARRARRSTPSTRRSPTS